MARVSTYLNFKRETEAAFAFYRAVFGGDFGMLQRMGDVPTAPGQPPMAEADKQLIMHVELTILGGHVLMGTDSPDSMGFNLVQGNNVHINLEPDTRAETQRLFDALAAGGTVGMPLTDMFWGALFGHLVDRFGICWMFNCTSKS
ncbi:MAG: VOC family protein [Rhodoferax sp.]|nr:VOC family protein [Rhodoferax sp.]